MDWKGTLHMDCRAKSYYYTAIFCYFFLEYGMLFLILFSFLLQNQASPCRKALALYLALLFSSDMCGIYQHDDTLFATYDGERKQPREINVKANSASQG